MRSIPFFVLLVAGLLLTAACQTASSPGTGTTTASAPVFDAPEFGDAFWDHWGDGQAELSGYDLTFSRYREQRRGTAVTIFVTETFSNELRVKADPGVHPASDEVPVMKLNLVEDFPTGIYDYNLMTSSFLALAPSGGLPAGSPTKVSFSRQEWCGHVYSQLLFHPNVIRQTTHSYFDNEADWQGEINYPPDGIAEDALWFWARGMAAPLLEPGGSAKVKLLLSLQNSRIIHEELAWRAATLSRSGDTETVTVPAGSFTVERWSAAVEDGPTRTFYVEADAPHRIIKWETTDGELAEMLGSVREPYWKMNSNEYRSAVEGLGLSPRPLRTP
ncbi:MAG: hypothetical protein IH846_13990 [Acidobacteria bacterium]|nr:hypothetical protein [Acidobacteriota bacterium]